MFFTIKTIAFFVLDAIINTAKTAVWISLLGSAILLGGAPLVIYVLSDIHGNLRRFKSIMSQIKLSPNDTLYVLGDIVDRFPDGIKILKILMQMPNVKMLIGNHELMMLDCLDENYDFNNESDFYEYHDNLRVWYANGGRVTHNSIKHTKKETRKEIFTFLRSLPLSYDVELNGKKYKLCHAAPPELFERSGYRYANKTYFSVWKRWESFELISNEYITIYGHTPTYKYNPSSPLKIWYGDNRIDIDCGAGYDGNVGVETRLACLRLDDMKEFYSEEPKIEEKEKEYY